MTKEKNDNDYINFIIKKKKSKKITSNNNDSEFRNNYKNYQYDYEEDFYEPKN
ncbi:MAG: hypothetical protein R3Y64_07430 [Peptostreptococcaceae bacterium]